MDELLGYLLNELETLKIYPDLNLVVLSDHGMVDVSEDRLVILDDFISRLGDIYINGKGSHVQIDLKMGEEKYQSILMISLQKLVKILL